MKFIKRYSEFINEVVTPIEILKSTPYYQTTTKIDPALLTFDEYLNIVNPDNKWHDDNWKYTLKDLEMFSDISNKKLLFRKKVGNLDIEFYESIEKLQYSKYDHDNNTYQRDGKGDLIPYTDEEIKKMGVPIYDITMYAFHNKQCIGFISDEWGATLVVLADEYKGSGIGVTLTTIFRKKHPDRASGGFTQFGYNNIKKVQKEFIKEYLRNGIYSHLMKKGEITKERVMNILKSVGYTGKEITKISSYAKYYSKDDDFDNFLIWRFNDDSIIIFDKNIIEANKYENLANDLDMFIKAHVFIRWNEKTDEYDLYGSFGKTKKLEKIAIKCAMSSIKIEHNVGLSTRYYKDLSLQTQEILNELKENKEQYLVKQVETDYNKFDIITLKKPLIGNEIYYPAKRWFKKHDKYEEMANRISELAFQASENVEVAPIIK